MQQPVPTAPPAGPCAPDPHGHGLAGDVPIADVEDVPVADGRAGRYRPHARPRRTRQVCLRYTPHEYDTVTRAARAAGLTTTGYVADAALAAALQSDPPSTAPWRDALIELMAARAQVRRIGLNINRAARTLNTTGATSATRASRSRSANRR